MIILFPSDYFDVKQIDPDYVAEYDAVCKIPEFKTVLFNYDEFVSDGKIKLYPKGYYSSDCIYRGWMLTPEQYKSLYGFLFNKGITLINSPEEYNACHLFPNVRATLGLYTPRSLYFDNPVDIDWDLVNRTFSRFLVKDYVKSVKGFKFPDYFETPVNHEELNGRIAEFVELRGGLFTGGIVLKEYVDLKKYDGATNEYRAFYLFGQLLSLCRNSNQPDSCGFVPLDFVNRFANLQM